MVSTISFSVSATSYSWTMLGWQSNLRMRISRLMRTMRVCFFSKFSLDKNLSATCVGDNAMATTAEKATR